MVRVVAQGGPYFGTIDHVFVALFDGTRLHCTEIGTMIWLGEALTPNLLCRENVFNVFRLLLVCSHIEQQWAHPVETNRIENNRRPMTPQLFIHYELIGRIGALSAVFSGPVHP